MVRARSFDARHLDVAAFAAAEGRIDGTSVVGDFVRLAEATYPDAEAAKVDATWSVDGEIAPLESAGRVPVLGLVVDTTLRLQCQRCLEPMQQPMHVERRLFFVEGEERAAALDEASDDDVLALPRSLDVRSLVEDELLLALPLIPRHAVCPVELAAPASREDDDDPESPFAALAALRRNAAPS